MDTGAALGGTGLFISLVGIIYSAINHKHIKTRCCGREIEISLDIDSTETLGERKEREKKEKEEKEKKEKEEKEKKDREEKEKKEKEEKEKKEKEEKEEKERKEKEENKYKNTFIRSHIPRIVPHFDV